MFLTLRFVAEGKTIADTYNCKYIEVSALINVKVDDLLAGIISQINLRQSSSSCASHPIQPPGSDGRRSPIRLIGRLFGRPPFVSRSCDNLLVPWPEAALATRMLLVLKTVFGLLVPWPDVPLATTISMILKWCSVLPRSWRLDGWRVVKKQLVNAHWPTVYVCGCLQKIGVAF